MKKTITVFFCMAIVFLEGCSGTPVEINLGPGPTPVEVKPVPKITGDFAVVKDHLNKLIIAQDNYFRLTGRWSMTIKTLVMSKYLPERTGQILNSKIKIKKWMFSVRSLPFPHEDRSWCFSAHGPEGVVILASHTGLWLRQDGKISMSKSSLPPAEPWQRLPR
jgi:hypothetical protein